MRAMRRAILMGGLLLLAFALAGCPESKPDPCPAGTIAVLERCESLDAAVDAGDDAGP